jgi:hypothetical protein
MRPFGGISRRGCTLIEEDPLLREKIVKEISALYDLRSAIVHGRGKKPTFEETKQLFTYAKGAIEKALSLRHLSKGELTKTLDEE